MTQHTIEDYGIEHIKECKHMAARMALATIHELYDDMKEDCSLSKSDLEKTMLAVKIIAMLDGNMSMAAAKPVGIK